MWFDDAVRAHLHHCRRVWRQVRAAFIHTSICSQQQENEHRIPAPRLHPGQHVLLSAKNLLQETGPVVLRSI